MRINEADNSMVGAEKVPRFTECDRVKLSTLCTKLKGMHETWAIGEEIASM